MNTKPIIPIITLAAAGITCFVSIAQGVEFDIFTKRFLITVVIFLVLSTIIKMVLDKAFNVVEEVPKVEDPDEDELSEEDDDTDFTSLDSDSDENY